MIVKALSGIGVEAKVPGELMFLKNFYKSQTLSDQRLRSSSYRDPRGDKVTVFNKLPAMIEYYLTRWEDLNLISSYNPEVFDLTHKTEAFVENPASLLENMKKDSLEQFCGLED